MPTPNPAAEKAAFLSSHVYSTAPEAAAKRRIDETLMGGDFANRGKIDMASEAYLSELIYLASGGRRVVKTARRARGCSSSSSRAAAKVS